ncbi:MAG: PAS domain S-box protein [Caldisericaceae bacterium]
MADKGESALLRRADILLAVVRSTGFFFKEKDWETGVLRAVEHVGRAMKVSRVYVFQFEENSQGEIYARQKFEWVNFGISKQINNPKLQNIDIKNEGFNDLFELFRQGKPFSGLVRNLPTAYRSILEMQSIKSIALFPIFVDKSLWGFVGFDECVEEREFSQFEIEILGAFALVIGFALEWKNSQEKLVEKESFESIIFENMKDLVTLQDGQQRLLFVNKRENELFGLPSENLVGKKCYELFGRDSPCDGCPVAKALVSGTSEQGEVQTPDGRWWNTKAIPVKGSSGVVERVIEISSDITEIRKMKESAEESRRRFESVFNESAVGFVIADKNEQIIDSNESFAKMIGYSREELLGMRWVEYTYLEDLENDLDLHEKLVNGEISQYTNEKRFVRKDGSYFWGRFTVSSIMKDKEGNFLYDVGVVEDISKLKEKEAKVEQLLLYQAFAREVAELVLREDDENTFLQKLCRKIVSGLDFVVFDWIGYKQENSLEIKPVVFAGSEEGYLKKIKIILYDETYGKGPVGIAITHNKPFIVNDIENDPVFAPWREEALKRGFMSSIALPLTYLDNAIGSLNLYSSKKNAFGKDEAGILGEIANDISVGISKIRLIKQSHQKA